MDSEDILIRKLSHDEHDLFEQDTQSCFEELPGDINAPTYTIADILKSCMHSKGWHNVRTSFTASGSIKTFVVSSGQHNAEMTDIGYGNPQFIP